jgi:hypothetical protein
MKTVFQPLGVLAKASNYEHLPIAGHGPIPMPDIARVFKIRFHTFGLIERNERVTLEFALEGPDG